MIFSPKEVDLISCLRNFLARHNIYRMELLQATNQDWFVNINEASIDGLSETLPDAIKEALEITREELRYQGDQ